MMIGPVQIDLNELAGAAVTLYGAFSLWRIKTMKAKALLAANRAAEIETSVFPAPTPNPGGTDDQAHRGTADPS